MPLQMREIAPRTIVSAGAIQVALRHFQCAVDPQCLLETSVGEHAEAQTELVCIVAANTQALRAVSQELRWCKERNLASGATRD